MADNKSLYSEVSKYYVENALVTSRVDQERYARAKEREALYNDNWSRQKVNINEIVDEFCPNFTTKNKGEKFIFKGERYDISADMAAGYLRIRDKKLGEWVKLDGTPGSIEETHFKIKKREEM